MLATQLNALVKGNTSARTPSRSLINLHAICAEQTVRGCSHRVYFIVLTRFRKLISILALTVVSTDEEKIGRPDRHYHQPPEQPQLVIPIPSLLYLPPACPATAGSAAASTGSSGESGRPGSIYPIEASARIRIIGPLRRASPKV